MSDMTTTDEAPAAKKERASRASYYEREGVGLVRAMGGVEEPIAFGYMDLHKAAREYYIGARSRGASHDDIVSGRAFPDRSPPSRLMPKPAKDERVRAAIAGVKAMEPGFTGDAKAWADSLTASQVASLRRVPAVRAELDRLNGTAASLDEVLMANSTADDESPAA